MHNLKSFTYCKVCNSFLLWLLEQMHVSPQRTQSNYHCLCGDDHSCKDSNWNTGSSNEESNLEMSHLTIFREHNISRGGLKSYKDICKQCYGWWLGSCWAEHQLLQWDSSWLSYSLSRYGSSDLLGESWMVSILFIFSSIILPNDPKLLLGEGAVYKL